MAPAAGIECDDEKSRSEPSLELYVYYASLGRYGSLACGQLGTSGKYTTPPFGLTASAYRVDCITRVTLLYTLAS